MTEYEDTKALIADESVTLTAEEYAARFVGNMRAYDQSRPRSMQTASHKLGVSDIGRCPQYAVLLTKETEFTDSPDHSAALMGTFIHEGIAVARHWMDEDLILDGEVRITLPNGVTISGHPDEVDQWENSVTDYKTADGVAVYRRTGPSDQQRFQVALYALGCLQSGLLTDVRPLTTRIIWIDRGGSEEPVVWQKEWHPEDVLPAVEWLDSVIYAVQHDEDGERAMPVDWCAKTCPFYSACRLPDLPETGEIIEDQELANAVRTYMQAHLDEKEAKAVKESAKALIEGVAGLVPTEDGSMIRVRWVTIGAQERAATTTKPYKRIDLRVI